MIAKVNGTEIFYETHGAGIPILFMHGGPGLDHTYFRPYMDKLGDNGFQLIYYDHRGNGRSAIPESYEGLSIGTLADDAEALRKYLGLDKIIVYGQSFGGVIAQEYALRYGENLKGLILESSVTVFDYPEVMIPNAQKRSTSEQFEVIMKLFSEPIPDDDTFKQMVDTILPIYFHKPDADICSNMANNMYFKAQAFNHFLGKCAPTHESFDRVRNITISTLILNGQDDWITPVEHSGKRLQTLIPRAECMIFDNSGHYPSIEENEKVVGTVKRWMKSI